MSRTYKYIISIMVFGLFTVVYLFLGQTSNVFWEVFGYTIKDFLLLCFVSIEFAHNKSITSRLVSIGLGSYLLMPLLIRIFCAFRSEMDYAIYRKLLCNDNYKLLLTLVLFAIILMIYKSFSNDTRRN